MANKFIARIATGVVAVGLGAILAQAAAPTAAQGAITAKGFLDIGAGTTVPDLTGNAKFPDKPDVVYYYPYFEWNATGDIATAANNAYGDNYGAQMLGYFYPPATGDYIFWLSADDGANLYLSTDETPANKKLIAQEAGWSNPRMWDTIGGGSTVEAKNSSTFAGTGWPTKDPVNGGAKITLTKGRAYYIEALMKEGGGGDNLAVAVQDPGFTIDATLPIPGEYLASIDKQNGPPTFITQPQSVSVSEGSSVTFTVVMDGTPPYTYQWLSNNVAIAGATGPAYTIARVPPSANGAKFKCTVTNPVNSATSQEATLTITGDLAPPTLVSAKGSTDFLGVVVTFSEPIEPVSAGNKANYSIAGLTINAVTVFDSSVVLDTSKQAEGATYTVVVNNVKDQSTAGNTIAANSQAQFKTFVFMLGRVLHKKYDNVDDNTGGNPDNLFNDPRFPNQPDRMDLMSVWEYPPDGGTRVAADPVRNYFDTLEGFFIPPTTDNYVFFIAGADRWWLYLSTDEDPANKYMIAAEPGGWTEPRYWNTTHDTDPLRHRTDFSTYNAWPTGPTITLTGGKRYYMLEVHHDPSWCGADDFSATYIKEGEADPVDGSAPTLTGSVVGSYVDPSGSEINITQQPVDTTQQQGRAAKFTVTATGTSAYGGTVTYQWQRQAPGGATWQDLAGATLASYTTPLLTLADSGAKYQVVCSVIGLTVNSAVAALTVVPDTFAPLLVGASAIASETGTTFDVGVTFDEAVTAASAGTLANYTLSAGTISAVTYYPGSPGVVLKVSGLTVGNTYTVTVANVVDLIGNKMSATAKDFKVSAMKWGVVGAKELGLGNGVLAVAENGFDAYSDSIAEWGTYDEATFVYEEVTGDFDKVVRVEYQDSSSQWARAGLVVRDVTNFGVDRATQEGGAAGRYQKVHVNPVVTAMGTAGNNAWEGNRRVETGAATTSAGGGGVPQYPYAWCRLQRAGDLFTIFRSDDGVTWTQLGTTTFTEPMPAKLYVGPEFAPENGNLTEESGLRGVWLAKFRDYGNYSAAVQPTLSLSNAGGNMVLTYSGVLQSSATVNGTYAPVAGAVSPYTVNKTGSAQFYRTAGQ